MIDDPFQELLPAYALDGLDPEETRQVEEHLLKCPPCREEAAALREAAAQMAYAAPQVQPPARLKTNILAQVQPQQRTWWARLNDFFSRTGVVWAAATFLLAGGLLVSNLGGGPPSENFHVVDLAGTDAAPEASGMMVISADGTAGTLIVDGLPELEEDQVYQLWLIRDGERTNGGLLWVDDWGYGSLWIDAPRPLADYPAFGITIEPEGGSPSPTGPRVLAGEL